MVSELKLQKYEAVVADCNQVLEAEPLNVKALHRRGVAYQGKNCYEQVGIKYMSYFAELFFNVSKGSFY